MASHDFLGDTLLLNRKWCDVTPKSLFVKRKKWNNFESYLMIKTSRSATFALGNHYQIQFTICVIGTFLRLWIVEVMKTN